MSAKSTASAPVSRRRFIRICAAAAAGMALKPASAFAHASLHRWTGIALGARAEINLLLEDKRTADKLFARIEAEIRRLEAIFSLYKADSELSRLNRNGSLAAPSLELVELLGLSRRIHDLTDGAFDPAVQPLWAHYARLAVEGAQSEQASDFKSALACTGFGKVRIQAGEISFRRPGMALTLNGIAQGFITDRVTSLLKANGCTDMVVDLGEISASGTAPRDLAPGGKGWPVTLRPDPRTPDAQVAVELTQQAVASSARLGTSFDQAETRSHILDPRTGLPVKNGLAGASVIAGTAALADGLSTAALVCGEDTLSAAIAEFSCSSAFIVRDDGTAAWLTG